MRNQIDTEILLQRTSDLIDSIIPNITYKDGIDLDDFTLNCFEHFLNYLNEIAFVDSLDVKELRKVFRGIVNQQLLQRLDIPLKNLSLDKKYTYKLFNTIL